LGIYTLAKELHISPAEAAILPTSLVAELLHIHMEIESFKSEQIEKATKESSQNMRKLKSKGGMSFR
jgi:hypothetical protein